MLRIVATIVLISLAHQALADELDPSSLAVPTGGHTAIAVDFETLFVGVVNDASTVAESHALALRNCGKPGCKVVRDSLAGAEVGLLPMHSVWLTSATEFEHVYCEGSVRMTQKPDYLQSDFAALALSESAMKVGKSNGQVTRFDAEAEALKDCQSASGAKDCRIVLSARGQSLGFRIFNHTWFEGEGDHLSQKSRQVMAIGISPHYRDTLSFRDSHGDNLVVGTVSANKSGVPFRVEEEKCR